MDDLIVGATISLVFLLPLGIVALIFIRADMRRTLRNAQGTTAQRLEKSEAAKFVAIVGCLFLLGGSLLAWKELPLAWADGRAEGIVVGQDTRRSGGGRRIGRSVTYAPVVEFSADGESFRFASSLSSDPSPYAPGARVPVRFDPADPQHAEIDAWHLLWAPLIFPAFGAIVISGALIWMRRARKKSASIRRLLASGTAVEGEIIGYRQAFGGKRSSAYRYAARWTDPSGAERTAWSEKFWGGPHDALIGRKVRVLIDPTTPLTYVDLDPMIAEIAPGNIR